MKRFNKGLLNVFIIVQLILLMPMLSQGKNEQYSVIKFGVTGKGIVDDTKAIQNAIDKSPIVYFPNGTYLISSIIIGDNKKILTEGFGVVFRQDKNSIGKQMFRIEGSDVSMDPISCIGNIHTDTSEFNYAIFVVPPLNKNTKNISIKGLVAKDIRGDGVSVGNSGNTYPENVLIENITVENCYRNGISVVSGKNITIRNVDVNHSGMQGIDIEGEGGDPAVLEDISISNVKAGNICISGAHIRAKRITCNNLSLDGRRQLSTPRYKPMQDAGIIIYSAEDVSISKVEITNMPGFALFVGDIYEFKERLCYRVFVNDMILKNNALVEKIYKSYICVMGLQSISFKNLSANLGSEHTLFYGKRSSFEGTQLVEISNSHINGGKLVAQNCIINADSVTIDNANQVFANMHGVLLSNCQLSMAGMEPYFSESNSGKNAKVKIVNTYLNNTRVINSTIDQYKWVQQ